MRLLVIDGNSIANRAFFGIKLLTTKDGRYTNAIYGFLNILLSLLKECEPDEVAVAFDLKAPTFRHKMYDGYKATRHGMPEELAQQMPVLKELLADLGYRTVTAEGWEADDILGTLAAACAARKDDCFLATGDRDSLQLVSDTTTVLLAATVMGRSKTVTMDVDAIQEKYGIQPRQLIEVKSLMGDASDNIPGVKGIGEKTALTLVQNFGTLEGVYEHIDDKLIKPKQREHLLECREMAQLSHTLGTIRTDAPIDTAEGTYAVGEGNKAEAVRLLQELEIHSLIPRFGLDGIAPAAPEEEDGIELAEAGLEALPLAPSGTYLVASRPAVMGKQGTRNVVLQPESWYAVQDCTVYPLEDADLMRLLDNADVTLEVFNAAPLYAKAMAAGGWGSSIVWDGKLAAYLLDASASKYQISELTASYRAAAAFTCADYPDAGRLADLFCKMKAEITACGEDALYNEIEFPLAQVLADMTRTGILVDREGIEACVVRLRQELPVEERCALLAGLEREYPALYDDVAAALKSGGSILWKKYQIHNHLQNCRCYEDIVAARRSYQGASPMDDFEQECVALWMQLLRRDVYQGMPLKNLVPQMGRAVDALPRGVFSLEAAHELQRRPRAYFWSCMTYRTMMDYVLDGAPSSNVQALLQTRDSGADGNKLHFLDAVWQLYRDPSRTEPMTELVLDGHLPARDREEICNQLLPLAAKLKAASNQAIFAWDLMLLSCSRVEAGRVVYDCGSLIKKIEGIPALKMGVSGSQSLQLEHSVILRDEKVRSDLRKAAGRGDSLLSEQLEKTLKAWGKARRPDNGHGKRLSSDPPAAEKKGIFSIFDRSDRGGRTEKSDRGFIFDDYDGDSGKRGRNRRR